MTVPIPAQPSFAQELERLLVELAFEVEHALNNQNVINATIDDIKGKITATHQDSVRELLDSVGEPLLNDIVGKIPTPQEYEQMLWVIRWYKDRIVGLRARLDTTE